MAKKRATASRSTKKTTHKKTHHLPFWHKVRVLSYIGIITALVVSNFGIGTIMQRDIALAAVCQTPNTQVYSQYPVSGYFMYTSTDQCQTRISLESMHKVGADTAVTFGSSLKQVTPTELRNDALYRNFAEGGRHGYDLAWYATGGGRIAKVFTYSDKILFGSKAHMCGDRDGTITTTSGTFDWFLVPTDAGYSDCTSPSKTYDLIVSSSKSGKDANSTLIKEAELYNMQIYLGMPKTDNHQTSYSHTFGSFTTRVLKSWQQLYGNSKAFAGVYQTEEIWLGKNPSTGSLKLYDIQHKIVTYQLASNKRTILVSPYASLYRSQGHTLSDIASATKRIVATSNGATMILAPQDGAGTGRVGLYDPYESGYQVRKAITDATGNTTANSALYIGDTQAFIRTVAQAGGVATWGNVEAFKPGGQPGNRPLSDRATLDKQIRRVAPVVSKVIAYRWNDYMTKINPTTQTSLYASIYAYSNKPMLASVSRINGGLSLTGYKFNTKGPSTVVVNSNGIVRRLTVQPSAFGTHLNGRMQTLNLAVNGLQTGKAVYVLVNNGTEKTNTLGATY